MLADRLTVDPRRTLPSGSSLIDGPDRIDSERRHLRLFVVRALAFWWPFLAFVAMVLWVDPYDFYGEHGPVPLAIKENTSRRLHDPLWKCPAFRRHPTPNILLGDSRADALPAAEIEAVTGEPYFNFAYGGATIPEIVETFWYASSLIRLQRVYVGLDFSLIFEGRHLHDRVKEARALMSSPALYPFDRVVLTAFFYNLYAVGFDSSFRVGVPSMSPEEFWRLQLTITAAKVYSTYRHSDDFMIQLRRIADYCRANGIALILFIPPTHVDLQQAIGRYGLSDSAARWRKELRELAVVYDFDNPNAFTSDRSNFNDPFHFRDPSPIIREIWGAPTGLAVRTEPLSPGPPASLEESSATGGNG